MNHHASFAAAAIIVVGLLGAGCKDAAQEPPLDSRLADGRAHTDLAGQGWPDAAPPADGGPVEARVTDGGLLPDARSCAPLPPVSTTALFTQLEADLPALTDPAKRKARVDAFFAELGKPGVYPLRDATSVILVHRGALSQEFSLAGDFNGWTPGVEPFVQLLDTDVYYVKRALDAGRHEYKLVDAAGEDWRTDALNTHLAWDGIHQVGLGEFNSVIPPFGAVHPSGRLEHFRLTSPQLKETRSVYVYLPAAYDRERCHRYPLLVVHDGNESITRGHFDEVTAQTLAAGRAQPVLVAFVALADQNKRLDQYSCQVTSSGPKYADYLCDTLVPALERRYRLAPDAAQRALAGASMGGLISYAALFWRNDCFQRAAAQSGSFWYADEEMVKRVKGTNPRVKLVRAYLDNGSDNAASTHDLRDALKTQGYPVHHWENLQQDHSWEAWQDRFDELLSYLFPPVPAP